MPVRRNFRFRLFRAFFEVPPWPRGPATRLGGRGVLRMGYLNKAYIRAPKRDRLWLRWRLNRPLRIPVAGDFSGMRKARKLCRQRCCWGTCRVPLWLAILYAATLFCEARHNHLEQLQHGHLDPHAPPMHSCDFGRPNSCEIGQPPIHRERTGDKMKICHDLDRGAPGFPVK